MLHNSQRRIYVDCYKKMQTALTNTQQINLAHSPLNNHSPHKHQRPSMYNNVKIAPSRRFEVHQ